MFMVYGDVTRLSCDAWLLPCDSEMGVLPHWLRWPPSRQAPPLPAASAAWRSGRERVMPFPGWHDDGPQAWLTNAGAAQPIAWHVEGARQFLDTVADSLRGAPRNGRARHLVAVPLVGTGAGGAYHAAGAVIETILPVLTAAASRHRFDIALVTKELSASAAAQAERRRHQSRDDAWCDLTKPQREKAEDLARRAAAGELVLFLGAGVSAGAGLPGWNELLRELAVEAGMSARPARSPGGRGQGSWWTRSR